MLWLYDVNLFCKLILKPSKIIQMDISPFFQIVSCSGASNTGKYADEVDVGSQQVVMPA